ncbi:MAG: diguanylate cyclase [Magnetococcales bacterium]|nr:diguanylate cyclase [Magnetococcales bacterium]
MFDIGLGKVQRDHPATRLLISVLTNGVKYVLARDVARQKEVERILKDLARGVPEEEFEPRFLEPLRVVSRWLRETADEWAKLERLGSSAQRELADLGQAGVPPEIVERLLRGIGVLGQGETWIDTEVRGLLQRTREVENPDFIQALTLFCDRVIREGEALQQSWRKEREAFVALVAEVAGCIQDVRLQTGGLDRKLGGSIARLKESRTITDLAKLRELLVREAESLKHHTQQVNQKLAESQQQLRETQEALVRVSHELAQTKVESLTDRLTGIPNRRALDEQLEREIARSVRHALPLSLIMFDLDHFKRINDTYGHPVGDKVLAAVANQTTSQLRQSDYLARFGGEEFTIILPETDLAAAVSTANKIRLEVASLRFKIGGQHIQATASFGVCALADCLTDCNTARHAEALASGEGIPWMAGRLLKCADLGLYRAKEGGRNRVETVTMGDAELDASEATSPPDSAPGNP